MSILIKGMKMPENCKKCRCSWYDFTRLYCEADGKPWGLEVTEYADGRHPNCPLVEIPPHSDLIDINALKLAIVNVDYVNKHDYLKGVLNAINNAPTVIEASEVE